MSRLAKKPIQIPNGVKVLVKDDLLTVEGKQGTLTQKFLPLYVKIVVEGDKLNVERHGDEKFHKASQGLYYRIAQNMIKGVTDGFTKSLNIQGLGYKWEVKGKELLLTVGFSHPAVYQIPEGITLKLEKADLLVVSGADKQQVGQAAANIRDIKPPEPYKGKGVRYSTEHIKLKEGKTGK